MAVCEMCNTNHSKRIISSINMCDDCFAKIRKIRNDDTELISFYSVAGNRVGMSTKANKYIEELVNTKMKSSANYQSELLFLEQQKALAIKYASWQIYDCSCNGFTSGIRINDAERQWVLHNNGIYCTAYSFDDLNDYEIVENGNTIQRGTADKALLGAFFFGVSGAIVGAACAQKSDEIVTDLHIRVSVNNIDNPIQIINIISSPISKDSSAYKNIATMTEKLIGALEYIKAKKKEESVSNSSNFSIADELLKLKNLMDMGVLTQEEFNQQKEKLLSL